MLGPAHFPAYFPGQDRSCTRRSVLFAGPALTGLALLAAPTAYAAPSVSTAIEAPGRRVVNAAISHLGQDASIVLTPEQIAAGVAWCSEFACLVVTEAATASLFTLGTPGTAVNTTCNRWYRWAGANGRLRWSDPTLKADPLAPNSLLTSGVRPRPGDVVLEWHVKKIGIWSVHTAIVEFTEILSGRLVLHTIDGNWGGIIRRRTVDTDVKGKVYAIISPGWE